MCICISQATANDLLAFYPEVASRVRVIYHGAEHLGGGPRVDSPDYAAHRNVSDYALFVGDRTSYKNFSIVLQAMTHKAWPVSVRLHVVGPAWSPAEEALARSFGLSGRVEYVGKLSDQELRREYQDATCFVFPSLLEGFGIPVVESQANGTPVVCSDIPVFREVAGTAAVFFDPRFAERLAEAVASVQEEDVRRQLIAAGLANVRRFCWDRAAKETVAVYQEAAEKAGIRS
jgi:glycosyltransferase involved in cell wall biosynthesis